MKTSNVSAEERVEHTPRCQQCLKALRPTYKMEGGRTLHADIPEELELIKAGRPDTWREYRVWTQPLVETKEVVGYGYKSNGIFCSLRCGFEAGIDCHSGKPSAEREALVSALRAAEEWLNRFAEHAPIQFGGETELTEKIRAALSRGFIVG